MSDEGSEARLMALGPGLFKALKDLLERVDINGGIGEYNGGPVFAVSRARALIKRAEG